MTPTHTNPTRPIGNRYTARAPYNFVSLPEDVVQARSWLKQDTFAEGLSGRIHCTLTTKSPTYIRGMLTKEDHQALSGKKVEDYTDQDWKKIAAFFGYTQDEQGKLVPVIPGSSLRGMLRSLVEIISYSRIRWVSDHHAFFFREVGRNPHSPLTDEYTTKIGRFASNVRAGLLAYDPQKQCWTIQEVKTPHQLNNHFHQEIHYFQVHDNIAAGASLPGFHSFNNLNYHKAPVTTYIPVSFNARRDQQIIQRGHHAFPVKKNLVDTIGGPENVNHPFNGFLVYTGNMKENNPTGNSPRRFHPVISKEKTGKAYNIDPQAVKAYIDNLSEAQKEWFGDKGCLKHDHPVFFVPPQHANGTVIYFGHNPYLRVPATQNRRISRVRDFIPPSALGTIQPDLADVIFGWTEDTVEKIGPEDQKKGCVSIEDAHFVRAGEAGIWHPDNPRIPQILGEPKPSAYQHYLVQDKSQGHDPDDGSSMAHYGTPPDETQIRGNKRYWHKGNNPPAFKQADDEEVIQHRSQYTRANTINPEVTFVFDIRFSHLRPEELGALCWALRLSGEPNTKYYHRIGMGKPLGMGLIEIEPALFLIDRNDRYCQLFVEKKGTISWKEAESPTKMKEYLDAFERFILDRIDPDATQLIQQKRIQELLAFHRDIPNVTTGWLNTVDYMALEDFKVKPVLPDPLKVLEEGHQQTQLPAVRSRPTDITRPKRLQIGDTLDHCRVDYVDRPGECSEVYLTLPRYQDYLFLIPKSTTPTPYEEGQTVTVKILAITEDPYEGETIITCKPIR